jgi:hypothetical protein
VRLLIFGLGYTAKRIAGRAREAGAVVTATGRDGDLDFGDAEAVRHAIATATHVLSSVPPGAGGDPVLEAYGDLLGHSPTPVRPEAVEAPVPGARPSTASGRTVDGRKGAPWLSYLSSTGVYGDAGGAWVDECAPIAGRRPERNRADAAWLALGARVFRLPGIYGPGRSPLDRVADGTAHVTGLPEQVFSRVHVDDIASGVVAGLEAPPGAYNLADDVPASQDRVVAYAARLLGRPMPRTVALEELSPQARAFYAENRRVSNAKAKRVLGWRPTYSDYRLGLRALKAITMPIATSTAPAAASADQR